MQNFGRVLDSEHKYDEAEAILRQALEIQNKILGSEHQDTLWTKQVLANTLRDEGHLSDAEQLMREPLLLDSGRWERNIRTHSGP